MGTVITAIGISVYLFVLSPAQAQSVTGDIRSELRTLQNELFSCSKIRKRFRAYRREYPELHFYFAGRKANTITGIRGCGYGFSANPAIAQAIALEGCKKSEVRFGTDGGTKTCRLMK